LDTLHPVKIIQTKFTLRVRVYSNSKMETFTKVSGKTASMKAMAHYSMQRARSLKTKSFWGMLNLQELSKMVSVWRELLSTKTETSIMALLKMV